ncbi:alpha/beta-tubulin-N-acetyltransferase 9-like [Babylonia areolata]|uniref:alpha/beta-tubulin-N-acetyltransferase 9-like n=1 Tax=Babylonia areolata TaxID=304850 RepID=UPI003FD3630D
MKINENVVIVGRKVILVPYESCHVPKYHEWMKSEELQQLTASEPLSLEEEYAMQKAWRQDENKCTFIVAEKERYEQTVQQNQQEAETGSMVGDVNLFLLEDAQQVAEVEIMIAEESARGKGLGKEAVCSMMRYGVEQLGMKKYVAKIGLQNGPSIRLFTQLGFTETSRSDVFQEVTMEVDVSEQFTHLLHSFTPQYAQRSHTTSLP